MARMSLWLCIRFPQLALDCQPHPISYGNEDNHEQPVVVIEQQRVIAANAAAMAAGVKLGYSSASVRALIDDNALLLLQRDPKQEQTTLERLQLWAYSISPTLEPWNNNCLQLEIGRCLRLYGSVESITQKAKLALTQRGFTTQMGAAYSRTGAWLMTFLADTEQALDSHTAVGQRAATLPISLINHDHREDHRQTVTRLQRAGIEQFESLLALPPSSLAKRCGTAFVRWIEALTAHHDQVSADYQLPTHFYDALWFGFDIRHTDELVPAISQLLNSLCQFLKNIQRETQCIEWQLLRAKGPPQCVSVRATGAYNNPARWQELTLLQLAQCTLADNVEGLALSVRDFQEPTTTVSDLFSLERTGEPRQALLDRLKNRLGLMAVQHIGLRDSHVPEHHHHSSTEFAPSSSDVTPPQQRPFWLMAEPQPVRQEQGQLFWNGPLTLRHGPERIEDNWWQRPISRDYYIATDPQGQPLWLFQDRHNRRWYVHGVMA